MRLLVDTHVLLWWLVDDDALTGDVKALLDEEPDAFSSAASVWEIGIKQASGKLRGPDDLLERVLDSGLRQLPMTGAHAVRASRLPRLHADPFDRMLVAQAQLEGLVLVTKDPVLRDYEVETLAW